VDAALLPFGQVDMTLPFLPLLGATDASGIYGLGATVANMPAEDLRRLARLTAKCGHHVTFADGDDLAHRENLVGQGFPIDLSLSDFEVVVCAKVESPEHINVEEARALLVYVRWVLRSRSRTGRRLVVLLDSMVALGAVSKGRSSSWPLNRVLRQIAALCFAGDLRLHLVFVPTEHNPADHPSRGGPGTWPAALKTHREERTALPPNVPRVQRRLDELNESWKRLYDCGMLD
jgi:hypothetical protein